MNTRENTLIIKEPTINVEKALVSKYPAFIDKPAPFKRSALFMLKKLVHENEINSFLDINKDATGFEFIERVLEYFNFGYSISNHDRANIPSSGRVVIIANHPLGALDGLALLKMVGEVRRDVRIVANDVLMNFDPIKNLFLPVDNLGKSTRKRDIERIVEALHQEQAIIVFPAGEVSRAGITGVKDDKWNSGFIRFARKANAPVLPIFIGGKNSSLFYSVSYINKTLSTLMLAREMFNKRSVTIPMRVGEPIPFSQIDAVPVSTAEKTKLLKKHLYRIAKNKKPLFLTEKTIAHPQNRQNLKQELRESELLGETIDGKKIYLFDYKAESAVIQEIGRLREIAFRCVGEGTGDKKDLDLYDQYYRHLILWDEDELEIAGAYRLAEAGKMDPTATNTGLYSATLFKYGEQMKPYFEQGIELGRSFIQPKYWGKRSLDYLWYGIGAYLRKHPEVRYMFGPVSLSNSYPRVAKDMLVWFYSHYFNDSEDLGHSFSPYVLDQEALNNMDRMFSGDNYKADFRVLKEQLEFLGVSVPTLYKQYSELCEEGGVRFLDFGVDADFNYCIDGLVLVDIEFVKAKKRKRYIGEDPVAETL
ncbi:lysophospholipid acyltransferase family protein [Neptuniibacter sp. 1_MG-2023]|jgi:putative hemolysin|uniref:lysophospholipid acyltransferase family protein n=1 Tax=Neptuniibacter sp. 1_MG-2023 TaxID=3062662 RepID=UPI0026E28F7F|nr:lysophospholipid acyltransferase family protein [Neptuniibacter sp. 1_MG-2023]MDO6592648.1 lysophospholipid acyltransferase family protein [Neptuniibacter sp. 1_MG-2023]